MKSMKMREILKVTIPLLFVAIALSAGPRPAAGSTALTPQATCPEMGGPINPDLYVDYEGKRIYLCCEMCRDSVAKDPRKAIRTLAARGQAVQAIPTREKAAAVPIKKRTLAHSCG